MTDAPNETADIPPLKLHWESRRITQCQADEDDCCEWPNCPQIHDDEPRRTGRHCPWDITND